MANDKKKQTSGPACLPAWPEKCSAQEFSATLYIVFSLDFYIFQNEERQILKIKQATHDSQY